MIENKLLVVYQLFLNYSSLNFLKHVRILETKLANMSIVPKFRTECLKNFHASQLEVRIILVKKH